MKTCPVCVKEFFAANPAQVYCGADCKRKQATVVWRAKYKSTLPESKTCEICKEQYKPVVTHQKWCSGCKREGYRESNRKWDARQKAARDLPTKICVICQQEYVPARCDQLTCHEAACVKERNAQTNKWHALKRHGLARQCAFPGCLTITDRQDGYCSENHQRRHAIALEGAAILREFAGVG